ncbi:MAG: DUF2752 domain-containing protein [Bacteroidales bacterium]|nr:DUF2752 domain-containing protein [Bacteroidales bacterium]
MTILAVIAALVVVTVYYNFNPAECGWMPRCPSKLLTGCDCPSCGAQRALHALLHGDLRGAWQFNPFLIVGLPYLLVAVWGSLRFMPGREHVRRFASRSIVVYGYILLYIVWGIVRNVL